LLRTTAETRKKQDNYAQLGSDRHPDLFSCTATRVFNKQTYLLTY